MPVARERVDQELERRADVHPAVQQEELRRRRVAPRQHVVALAAQVDELRRRRAFTTRDRYFLATEREPSCQPVR